MVHILGFPPFVYPRLQIESGICAAPTADAATTGVVSD